jgi:hypothetical protein
MERNLKIVCFAGGTCGDMIAAMIDPQGIDFANNKMLVATERSRLKKPHTFANDVEKDQYLLLMQQQYRSLPSHDLDYHVNRKHEFISITVQDFKVALWAAERFKKLHRDTVWQDMIKFCGANTVEDYAQILIHYSNLVQSHTKKLLKLERILTGHGINDLRALTNVDLDSNIYNTWLSKQNYVG